MFYIILIIGSILAGSGIGGGSLFVLLCDILKLSSHLETMVYNLIMFIGVGISASIMNIKNKNFDKSIFLKLIFVTIISAIIGAIISNNLEENNLKLYFNIFILSLGIFEIISSLKNIIKDKNISIKKGE